MICWGWVFFGVFICAGGLVVFCWLLDYLGLPFWGWFVMVFVFEFCLLMFWWCWVLGLVLDFDLLMWVFVFSLWTLRFRFWVLLVCFVSCS